MSEDTTEIELLANPRKLSMSERALFEVGIAATNRGPATVNPGLMHARLYINGAESLRWGLTIANGVRRREWYALPPGQTVSITWTSMGSNFFPTPGEYELKLRLCDIESTPVFVRVE